MSAPTTLLDVTLKGIVGIGVGKVGEMGQQFPIVAALVGYLGSFLRTHMVGHNVQSHGIQQLLASASARHTCST
jgi:L-lactate permease